MDGRDRTAEILIERLHAFVWTLMECYEGHYTKPDGPKPETMQGFVEARDLLHDSFRELLERPSYVPAAIPPLVAERSPEDDDIAVLTAALDQIRGSGATFGSAVSSLAGELVRAIEVRCQRV